MVRSTAAKDRHDAAITEYVDYKDLEMLKRLREYERGKNVPVMIFSNSANTSSLSEAMEYGVHEYLLKSDWELPDLVQKVRKMLAA